MNLFFVGILPIFGFAAGSFLAAYGGAQYKKISELNKALEALDIRICAYNEGLSEALDSIADSTKCKLFDNIRSSLYSNSVNDVISQSQYSNEIKESIIRLVESISYADFSQIKKSFQTAEGIIQKELDKAKKENDKNSPLFRKIGALAGLALGILLL